MVLMLSVLAHAGPRSGGCSWGRVLQKETAMQKGKTALRVDVANDVRQLWKAGADVGGSLRRGAWAPGTTGPLLAAPHVCLNEDDEMRQGWG
jgi:hypothetical protein